MQDRESSLFFDETVWFTFRYFKERLHVAVVSPQRSWLPALQGGEWGGCVGPAPALGACAAPPSRVEHLLGLCQNGPTPQVPEPQPQPRWYLGLTSVCC